MNHIFEVQFTLEMIKIKKVNLCLMIFLFTVFILFKSILFKESAKCNLDLNKINENQINEYLISKLENFSFNLNETGFGFNIVPNIVHYVLFTVHEVEFGHFISLLSVLKNQKPEKVYIHCDCSQLSGDYYQRVLRVANKTNIPIIVRTIERSTQIFGKNLSKSFHNWHLSDITRNRVLQEFGGIYLDRDVYVVKSLDKFLKYEMTLNWDEGQYLATQTLIAHKNARFLKLWLDSYHDYRPDLWYYNAGQLPTTKYLQKDPSLVHRLKGGFGADAPKVCPLIFRIYYPNWRKDFYAIHLVIRGNEISFKNWCFGNKYS